MRFNPDDFSDDEKRQVLLDACAVGEDGPARRLADAWGIDLSVQAAAV